LHLYSSKFVLFEDVMCCNRPINVVRFAKYNQIKS